MISSSLTNQSAILNASTGCPSGQRVSIPCSFETMEGKRLIVDSEERLPISTPVNVEYSDALFLGVVVNCVARSADSWQVEIRVEQILTGLQSLMVLRSRLLGEGVAPEVGVGYARVCA